LSVTGITNARPEGCNRLVKQVKRVACGFRNAENSARPDSIPVHPQTSGRNPDFMLIARSKSKSRHGAPSRSPDKQHRAIPHYRAPPQDPYPTPNNLSA